jgi:hypothetical protein
MKMSVQMDAPVKEWNPIQAKEEEAAKKPLELIVYHEEWMYRAKKFFDKTDKEQRELARKHIESLRWEVQSGGENALEVQLIESKRRPICYITRFKGPYGEIKDYIYGKSMYVNEVLTVISAPHPRTWIMGQPQTGTYIAGPDSGPQLQLETRIEDVIAKLNLMRNDSNPKEPRFSEIREVTWMEMLTVDEEAMENMRVNKPHPESEIKQAKP